MGYKSAAQRKAVWASKKDGGKGNPNRKKKRKTKRKFKVWPSAYASGWGVRCTKAGGPGKMGKSKKKK